MAEPPLQCNCYDDRDDDAVLEDEEYQSLVPNAKPDSSSRTNSRLAFHAARSSRCGFAVMVFVIFLVLRGVIQWKIGHSWNAGADYTRTPKEHERIIRALYRQDRLIQRYGLDADLYEPVNNPTRTVKRISDFETLQQIRTGHCGRFQEKLDGATDTNWRLFAKHLSVHCINGETYRRFEDLFRYEKIYGDGLLGQFKKRRAQRSCSKPWLKRYVCEAEHPTLRGVTVTIERLGVFIGTGGYDWSSQASNIPLDNVGDLADRLPNDSWAFVGGMVAPVFANGTIIGHPPLHMHHAHIFPYGDKKERIKKIKGAYHHDLFFQSHGDSQCKDEEGGLACVLAMTDSGTARVVDHTQSGLSADFEFNDVREKGSEELHYFAEIVVMMTPYDSSEMRRSTFVGIANPCIGKGPCTYPIPLDLNSNFIAFNYTHGSLGSELSSGYMSNLIYHTHQTMADSVFIFKSSSDSTVMNAVDSFRQGRDYPVILDCSSGSNNTLEAAKEELFRLISGAGGQLVCEMTKPSLLFSPDSRGMLQAYDKRAQLNCLKGQIPLNVGEVLTVLAFNERRPHKLTRGSRAFAEQEPYDLGSFSTTQHTVFRFDLNYYEEPDYAPPSYFLYTNVTMHRVTSLDDVIHTGCPDGSIRFNT